MSQSSDKMLDLLQQISVLKELDHQYQVGDKNTANVREFKERRKRRRQIHDEMKELAARARQGHPSEH